MDLRKAFDSVRHEAVLIAAEAKGLPQPFLDYLAHLYKESKTTLYVKRRSSNMIKPNRGVRQGDPLSPILFNFVMDLMIKDLPKHIGYEFCGKVIRCIAFADDVIFVASTYGGLQDIINSAMINFSKFGLIFNTEKSGSLSLVPSGRDKKMKVVDDKPVFLKEQSLPTYNISDVFTYLGVKFGHSGKVMKTTSKLLEWLQALTKAPLKPQQRLFILRIFLIPKFYHQFVLGRTNIGELNKMDVKIRQFVRSWLRLPMDTPKAFFHTDVKDGGLSISSFRWNIPRLKIERLQKLQFHESLTFRNLFDDPSIQYELQLAKRWATDNTNKMLINKEDVKDSFSSKLYTNVDGYGLREANNVTSVHSWMTDGSSLLTGKDFIDCTKLRIGALPTKARMSRGRKEMDKKCRANCQSQESISHILQKCPRGHGNRIKRHDGVARLLSGYLLRKGLSVEREFLYKLSSGNVKPDIVAWNNNKKAFVVEVHVVHDAVPLAATRRDKILHYSQNTFLKQAVMCKTKCESVDFYTATISYRGVWEKQSANELMKLGITKAELKILTVRTLQGSLNIFRGFNTMTTSR